MEILNFVIRIRPRKACLLLFAVVCCIAAGLLSLVSFPTEDSLSDSPVLMVVYIASCCVAIGISAQWIFGARLFGEYLKTPFTIYEEHNVAEAEYSEVLKKYSLNCYYCSVQSGSYDEGECACSDNLSGKMVRYSGKQSKGSAECKLCFWILWGGFMVLACVALYDIAVPLVPKLYLIFWVLLATFLNGSSYFLCCTYVGFLDSFSKIKDLENYSHNHHAPTYSPEYEKLKSVARKNLQAFLFTSLQFSILVLLCAFLLSGDAPIGSLQLLCFVFVIVIGFVTFVILSVYSKVALETVLYRWSVCSVYAISKEYNDIVGCSDIDIVATSSKAEECLKAYERVMGKGRWNAGDALNSALAVASLAVNVATFILAIVRP